MALFLKHDVPTAFSTSPFWFWSAWFLRTRHFSLIFSFTIGRYQVFVYSNIDELLFSILVLAAITEMRLSTKHMETGADLGASFPSLARVDI